MTYTFSPLAFPLPAVGPAYYTYGFDINDTGQVVGTYGGELDAHAFLYSGGIYTNIDPVPGADWGQSAAVDISNDGKVLVYDAEPNSKSLFRSSVILLTVLQRERAAQRMYRRIPHRSLGA